jgi:hypothetical protein
VSAVIWCLVLAVLMMLALRDAPIVRWIPAWLYAIALGSALVAAGLNVFGWVQSAGSIVLAVFRGGLHLIGVS